MTKPKSLKPLVLALLLGAFGSASASTFLLMAPLNHGATTTPPATPAPEPEPEPLPEPEPQLSFILPERALTTYLALQGSTVAFPESFLRTNIAESERGDIQWSIEAPHSGVRLSGTELLITSSTPGVSRIPVTATYKGVSATMVFTMTASYAESCKVRKTYNPQDESGTYLLDVDGLAGPLPPASYYCDQDSEGGGWTQVVRQFEATPVAWTGAASGNSYTVAQAHFPAHTEMGLGSTKAAELEYFDYQYTTGNIPVSVITGKKSKQTFRIHRNTANYYDWHNPEASLSTNPLWVNTLTVHRTGAANSFNWAFSPQHNLAAARGYAYGGVDLQGVSDAMPWSVWVR